MEDCRRHPPNLFLVSDRQTGSTIPKMKWLRVRSEAIQMNIPQGVEEIISESYNMHTQFSGLSRDSLAFNINSQGATLINDCRIKSLSAKAPTLHFQSGQVDSLYLNLDFITEWTVDSDSFHIDTEHLSGSYEPNCYLQKMNAARCSGLR